MRFDFSLSPGARSPSRCAIDALTRPPEAAAVAALLAPASLDDAALTRVAADATRLVETLRSKRVKAGGVDALMREFSLSSDEGVALMCLAEALLRIPDAATRDALIRDKIGGGDWHAHVGQSPSLFVNAAAWGLVVTGRLVATHSARGLSASLTRIVARGGEPLIRTGVDLAMRMLGRQFVTGETIEDAIGNGRDNVRRGYRYSYDMLGEAALTQHDAERYLASYRHAIEAIGTSAGEAGGGASDVRARPGISIKLSALHPRYGRATRDRVMRELLPVVKDLALSARRHDIGLNIDAEESERLDLSLDLLEALAEDRDLDGWNGLGFVIQAYQKRAPAVIAFVAELSRRTRSRAARTLMVRLVKGAYWDSEIKRAQVEGQSGYPVYTRKAHTDVAYQACARMLLEAADAIYPQFATHNAYTLAWVRETARGIGVAESDYEFQCLHGMGETLYDQVVSDSTPLSCRIYAPVGSHETLLAYLVRRLLENGANTSFVNRIVDARVPITELVADPLQHVRDSGGAPHPQIPLPGALYPDGRVNSAGFDASNDSALKTMAEALAALDEGGWSTDEPAFATIVNPADHTDRLGAIATASASQIASAVANAVKAGEAWRAQPPAERAALLMRCADQLEAHRPELIALAIREAGKTFGNAIGEVREAVDFCRYYAMQIADDAAVAGDAQAGGPLVCISPWNFPLAIFTGQVVAALAAGRCVLAKPAEQTPLIAARAVALFHAAGVPHDVLQLLPGDGEQVGAPLVAHPAISGVLFTGSTEVARSIAATLAKRDDDPVLVAETGGQNALIVDSSALTEQVVNDALVSAFDSAGQRCSALRILCLQDEVYDTTLTMLEGAMAELAVGDPARLSTDVGPAIDADARDRLVAHIERMRAAGHRVHSLPLPPECARGTFVAPTVIEIDRIEDIPGEVFGPVLHVLRWRFGTLDALIDAIDATGYGLTMGIHSRIDEHIARVAARARVGNLYVNRTLIGATVGVQPFGGEGLSGTGPKAGGPFYLARLDEGRGAHRFRPGAGAPLDADRLGPLREAIAACPALDDALKARLDMHCVLCEAAAMGLTTMTLPGPTGETNTLTLRPRERIACIADDPAALIRQVIAARSIGIVPAARVARLPAALHPFVDPWDGDVATIEGLEALLLAVPAGERVRTKAACAARPGPLVAVIPWDEGTEPVLQLWRLMREFAESVNTAAAGGNASLMTLTEG
jgi:RHH-type proline utilization regulon transcriptional repressor/proline dehydrogenase/delta 1-pyrroline-5-carboxylate dehydrogenase